MESDGTVTGCLANAFYPLIEEIYKLIREDSICTVYHYTSILGLESIISRKSLRFGDYRFFNDTQELEYTKSLVLDLLGNKKYESHPLYCQLKTLLTDDDFYNKRTLSFTTSSNMFGNNTIESEYRLFIFCCSCHQDLKDMWTYYTKDNMGFGYNLGFDVEELVANINMSQRDICVDAQGNSKLGFFNQIYNGRVIYNRKNQIDTLKKLLGTSRNLCSERPQEQEEIVRFFLKAVDLCSVFFKDPCFSNEQEYRFALFIPSKSINLINTNKSSEHKSIQRFQILHGAFAPKFDLSIHHLYQCIDEIMISPYNRMDYTEAGLREFLRYYSIDIPILKSDLKIRY